MQKKILALVIVSVVCGVILASCSTTAANQPQGGSTAASNPAPSSSSPSSQSSHGDLGSQSATSADNALGMVPISVETLYSGTDGIGKNDSDSSWDASVSTIISLEGSTASISGDGAAVSGNTVTITAAGTYVVSGKLSKGQIIVNAAKDDNVRMVLNGADIKAAENAAIYAAQANKLIVILADGTVNQLTDASSYVYADTEKEEPDGTLFAKCDLTINGTGTLVVNGNYKNAIRTKDDLVIVSGTFIVNAVNNGLHGKDSVTIYDGDFNITTGNDGIKTSDDSKKGWVEIRGGVFDITAEYDGIQAETDLLISGGEFVITTGGGSANAPVRSGSFDRMGGGMRPGGSGTSQQSSTTGDDGSKKSLKAKNTVHIADGDFVLDAYDDAIHSNSEIIITGGKFNIKTGDDGIHADVNVLITGGDIDITQSYEGIEGLTVTIAGGNIRITASDDGINASNGEGKALNGGRPTSGVNQNAYIRITGGVIDVYGGTDGIDSNGHIYIEGGMLMISGQSQIMEGAIDHDGDLIITGGEIITAGSWDNTPNSSTQPVILLSYSSTQPVGSVITIKDSQSNVILEYSSRTDFSMSGFTSPNFKIGETYLLYINGEKRTDIKLDGTNTTISDTGGAYSGGRGGPGGGMPNRGRR